MNLIKYPWSKSTHLFIFLIMWPFYHFCNITGKSKNHCMNLVFHEAQQVFKYQMSNVSNAFRIKNIAKKKPVYVNVCYLMPLFISYTSCDVRKYKQMLIISESKHNSHLTYCVCRARKTNIYFLSIYILIEPFKYYTSGL